MDFGDSFAGILKVFGVLLIPIILKSVGQKKKIEVRNTRKPTPIPMTSTRTSDASSHRSLEQSQNEYNKDIDVYSIKESKIIDEVENCITSEKIEKKVYAKEITDVIKQNEIGLQNINLSFKKEDLVKGIIMSEILSKPKGLQKKLR